MKSLLILTVCIFTFNLLAEVIPYEPGTVIVSRESLRDWQTQALSEKSATIHRGHGISLRHYAKKGKGRFVLSKNLGNIDCKGFDRFIYEPLIANYENAPNLIIEGFLETDVGTLKSSAPDVIEAKGRKYYSPCVEFDVSRAKVVKSIRLEISTVKDGIADGMFWTGMFMLRNTSEHDLYMKHYRRFADLKWEGLLKDENYQPQFKLQYQILFSNADLEKYRKQYGQYVGNRNVKAIPPPEGAVSANIGSNYRSSDNARRYLQQFKTPYSSYMWSNSMGLAFSAILKKDKALMRMAARYLLSTASFGAWNDNRREDTVGHYRWPAFTPSWHLYGLVVGMDCAGEMLTPAGRNYILKAMMLKGVAPITYSLWERNYAFNMNQGLSFLRGKVLALCIMDKTWPRVTPMLENSKRESDECMSRLFKADGSYMESLGYLAYTIECAIPIYEAYSIFAKKPLAEIIPGCMRNFGGYAEVVASTCEGNEQALIPLGQGHNWFNLPVLTTAFLATGCPGSMWVNLYKKISGDAKEKYFRNIGFCKGLRAMRLCALADKMPELKVLRPFILLKNCGLVASLREFRDEKVKLLVVGDAAGVGKKMYDTSSLVLEFAGDSFAMQMPVYGGVFFESQYRNMTVPILKNGLYANQKNLLGGDRQSTKQLSRNSQCPVAAGDAKAFKCAVDASLSWDKAYFKNYTRNIDSPTPDEINITDEYELGEKALGAAFMLITYLPVEIKDEMILISGKRGRASIKIPAGCTAKVEQFSPTGATLKGMNMKDGTQLNRLVISKEGKNGQKDKITVSIKLTSI